MADVEELSIVIRFCCTHKDSLTLRNQPTKLTKYFQKTFRDKLLNVIHELRILSSGPPSSSRIDYIVEVIQDESRRKVNDACSVLGLGQMLT